MKRTNNYKEAKNIAVCWGLTFKIQKRKMKINNKMLISKLIFL